MVQRLSTILAALLMAGTAFADPAPLAATTSVHAVSESPRPQARRIEYKLPEARWGNSGNRKQWSIAALSALRGPAERLPEIVPEDIASWCPAYPGAGRQDREAFWVGLVSALARHESTYRPTAVGGGGRWYGLLQILPATARSYDCQARSGDALKDPRLNLACGLRIMARTVARDGVVSRNMRGVAADWGPFHSRKKREDMMAWTRAQPYCAGLPKSLKPVARPVNWGAMMADAGGRAQVPEYDGVVAFAVDGAILRGGIDPVIATSGASPE
ncbi:transglycosylase SLT domain-containing protein [Citreicella sp. C3M06]|uniref:lytic transglycosylase domain-containing protein n=1 Tax=Citreicella sp. C3M06 TaxID=2841564 RepID=UPI001C09A857|nr:transglycosylase SLT domain-containing protein [Citreicella sp. C3M06]MBU2963424.1 transglycosylase SLT domain-containing protein [Citreicella sp. C3M06]